MAFFGKKKHKEAAQPPAASGSATVTGPISPASSGGHAGGNAGGMLQHQQQGPSMYPVQGGPLNGQHSGAGAGLEMHQQQQAPYSHQTGPPLNATSMYNQQPLQSQMFSAGGLPMSNGVVAGASPTPYSGAQGYHQQQPQTSPQQTGYPNGIMNAPPPRQFAHATSGSDSSMNPMRSQGGFPGPGSQIQSQPSERSQGPSSSSSTPVSYPWSQRTIQLQPVQPVPSSQQQATREITTSPFPRYGHSVNPVAQSNTGDLYLFGGLVKDSVKNDLYMVTCSALTANGGSSSDSKALAGAPINISMIETRGEIPCPRVGHTSVSVGNVLIVWGGDTKTREEDPQDDNLYLLNLGEQAALCREILANADKRLARLDFGKGHGSCSARPLWPRFCYQSQQVLHLWRTARCSRRST